MEQLFSFKNAGGNAGNMAALVEHEGADFMQVEQLESGARKSMGLGWQLARNMGQIWCLGAQESGVAGAAFRRSFLEHGSCRIYMQGKARASEGKKQGISSA